MRVKFKILFNSGTSKTYKSANTSYDNCEKLKQEYCDFFKKVYKENDDASFTVRNNIIRLKDTSSVKISVIL